MRRIKKRGRKYRFRESMNADLYGSQAIRTKYEYLFEGFLKEAQIPYVLNQVFCFTCDRHFTFESMDMPAKCAMCKVDLKGPEGGKIARPDFLVLDSEEKVAGIIRVDGEVHVERKATRIADYFILQAFNERNIKVFIVRNETLLKLTVPELRLVAQNIKLMLADDDLYKKYTMSKEFEELSYCPDIQIKKIRRR